MARRSTHISTFVATEAAASPSPGAKPLAVIRGSGNVFADLGFADPEGEAEKARLVVILRTEMERRKLSQGDLAAIIGVKQPDVSNLLRGRVEGFSLERLLGFTQKLGYDAEITLRRHQAERPSRRTLTVA